jgi:hypothetical protein
VKISIGDAFERQEKHGEAIASWRALCAPE